MLPWTSGLDRELAATVARQRVGKLSVPSTITSYGEKIRIAVSEFKCSLIATTSTSGLRLRSVSAADSTFGLPMSSWPCSSWRWRLEASTTSKSTMPIFPTPAAAGAGAAAAQEQHARAKQLSLAGAAYLGQDEMTGVAGDLVGGKGLG